MADRVAQWLEALGLGRYAQLFFDNEIDLNALPHIGDEDLKEIGVALGARRKIFAAIQAQANTGIDERAAEPAPDVELADDERAPGDAERRQLTVMFCDMVGSTELSTQLDAEDYREVIRVYQDACAGVIARYDGYVARFMGDGVLAYFGWPRAHEDDAARAINAGLGVVDAVAGLAPANGTAVAVRIGIATGPVVIGDIVGEGAAQEAAVTGETPNLAARLQQIAQPNTVVITPSTHALAGGLFDYESLGAQELKGVDGTPEVWRVMGERQVESRFAAAHGRQLTPLIGREEGLELLSRRWRRAADGEGQVVLLSGEPGIGKSRLTRALQDTLADQAHLRLLLQCSPHHTSSTLYPVINQLELAAGFATGDSAEVRLDKLATALAPAGQPADEILPLFASLLSIPAEDRYPLPRLTPQQQKDRTLAALIQQLEGLSAQQPVLFILEDAHWIDPTTQELIELTVEHIRDLPVLMVITYRPEFAAPWVGDDHVSLLALNRLTRKDRARMAQALLGDALSEEVLAQIAERSDGIPLFVEELTRAASEAGAGGTIPATLQDALEARFDRSPAVREVAQVGAAIGREFGYALLAHVASLDARDLDAALDDLVGSGLIFVRGTPPDASYTFKHALIQDTAHGSMVRSKRHDTHQRIAEALQALHPEIAETEPETLAHHYTEASLIDHAVDWWTKAGQSASARSANPEAVALLERGLSLVADLPEGETRDRKKLALQTALFGPLISVKGQYSSELESAFTRTLEICERVDAPEEMFRALFAKSLSHGMRGEHAMCNEAARELVQRAELASDEGAVLMGRRQLAMSLLLLGRVVEAQEQIDIVRSTYDQTRHGHVMVTYGQDPGIITEAYHSVSQWLLGWPAKSRATSEHVIGLVTELDHVNTVGPVLCWGGFNPQAIRRDIDGLRRTCRHFQALTAHHNMPIWEIMERIANALLQSLTNPSRQTAAVLKDSLVAYETMTSNAMYVPIFWGGFLAENFRAIGDAEQALGANDRGFAFAKASDEHWSDAELFRMRGVALALRDGANGNDEAETWLRRAIDDARSRQTKSFELRAAMSLARFLRDQGRHALARETLGPVYGWFTEGFETPDLIDAKALLDELS